MIVFDLKCAAGGHIFEAWFGSSEDYESQKARDLVQCPMCGDASVDKAVMAPRLGGTSPEVGREETVFSSDPTTVKSLMAALAAVQREMISRSDYVGERFADEARAIHLGEAEARSIYGKATPAETRILREEGIAVAPLPFPVVPPGEEN